MTVTERFPEPPSFLRVFVPVLLVTLLCGIVGPIFLVLGLVTDEPDTGWMVPIGLVITLSDVVVAVLIARARHRSRVRSLRLRRHGRPAQGRILSLEPTTVTVNDAPLMHLTMRIEGDGLTPIDVDARMVIPTFRLALMGRSVPVIVDPETHDWEFDWDKVPTVPEPGPTEEPAADRLAELDDLMHRDLISREEYDATRARILDEI